MTTNVLDLTYLNSYRFEICPIRPPSEAFSLLIRATRNCPWNKCAFCRAYTHHTFELRTAEEIIADIKQARQIRDGIIAAAWKMGYGNDIKSVAAYIFNQPTSNESVRQVALWMYGGSESVFLQDANTLIMRTPDLVRVVSLLKTTFPEITRITSYARSKTAARKTVAELKELHGAGLSRLHIGMESGSDAVLDFMKKGVTADEQIQGGRNVKESGIELSEYYMPGLGGKELIEDHIIGTARVLNAIDPDFVRLRTLNVFAARDLEQKIEQGEFTVLTEDEVVSEIGGLIEKLEITGVVKSDHMSNMLPEIDGRFPGAKEACLNAVKRYLSLPDGERLNYRLGRRAGVYEQLDDLNDIVRRKQVDDLISRAGLTAPDDFEKAIKQLTNRYM